MLKPNTIMLTGVILFVASFVPTVYPDLVAYAGLVLLIVALGQLKQKWINLKDLQYIFTLQGLGSYLAFIALIVFGLKLLTSWMVGILGGTPLVQTWLPMISPPLMVVTALAVMALGAIGGGSK